MNGKPATISGYLPFALSPSTPFVLSLSKDERRSAQACQRASGALRTGVSKGERRGFQQPAREREGCYAAGRRFTAIGAIGIIIVLLLTPCLISRKMGGEVQASAAKETHGGVQGNVYTMDPFLVNLADPEQMRYLKTRIDIEITEKKAGEEFEKRKPQLRDSIITILSSKTYREINDSEGKKKLKEEIISKLNQVLGQAKVKTVYFAEFVVQ